MAMPVMHKKGKEMPFSKLQLAVEMLDPKTKEVIGDDEGNEPWWLVDDTQRLRDALGCPLQSFDGEPACVVMPLLRAAEKKLAAAMPEYAPKEMVEELQAVREMLAWAKAFPMAIFNVC